MGREGRDYWEEQLSEYWDSGLTIQEYSELKELPYESARRWILWLYLLYDFTKSSGYFRWNCNLLTIYNNIIDENIISFTLWKRLNKIIVLRIFYL